jgi:hypothetical protein
LSPNAAQASPIIRQHLACERRREPQPNHLLHESAPGHFSGLYQFDKAPQMPFVHGVAPGFRARL